MKDPSYLFPHLTNVCPICHKRWPMIADYSLRWMAAGEVAKHLISEHGWQDVSTIEQDGKPTRWFYALGKLKSGLVVKIGNYHDCGPYRLPREGETVADDLAIG